MSSIDQQFVEFIVKSLVSKPDAVSIERRIDEKGVLLELTVDPEDLGRVIGKRGATAQSLRTLLRALGTKNDARYNLKIVDNGEPGAGRSQSSDDNSSSSDDSATTTSRRTDVDEDDDLGLDSSKTESSVVSKTRKELEELDDLDV
jgi:predicted RNA-binding protein YlqC (UPF0109 family)